MIKIAIVGGDWNSDGGRPSGFVTKLGTELRDAHVYNGGPITELSQVAELIPGYDLVLWMPNIPNDEEDVTFTKKVGSVVIVSKVLRENRTRSDAVARIFKYQGNAVLAVTKSGEGMINLELIDALNNTWTTSQDISKIVKEILSLYEWTKLSVRANTTRVTSVMEEFLDMNREVASKAENVTTRYFGNISTRCTKLFPTARLTQSTCLVSPRNVDKQSIREKDMVHCAKAGTEVMYVGDSKPSVDTPVQLELYAMFPHISFMIHGHLFVKGAPTTDSYHPCGDLNEVKEVADIISNEGKYSGVVNLRNHGFLMYADSVENMQKIIDSSEFVI